MRVLIAAGGTGGHIYPGIAVAQEIMRRDANSKVHFVGTARGLETRLVPQAGFELSLIESAGLKNVKLGARLKGIAVLPKSFVSTRKLLRQFQPDETKLFGSGGSDCRADESSDARDGVERVAGLDQPRAGAFRGSGGGVVRTGAALLSRQS